MVIGGNGDQLGVMATAKAIEVAEESGLDLVEVSPNSRPPVCKLMDYGKFKYKEQKKAAEARKKRTDNTVKEIRLRYRTDVGDLETKLSKAKGFLADGDKVKFSMRFRGREIMYVDLGQEKFNEVLEKLSGVAQLEERSSVSGRQIYIIVGPLAPGKEGAPKGDEEAKE